MGAEDRLPKWAQHELNRLRMNLKSAQAKLDAIASGGDKDNPFMLGFNDKGHTEKPLPFSHVGWKIGGDKYCDVEAYVERGRLTVQATGTMIVGLDVQPKANNVISVGTVKW